MDILFEDTSLLVVDKPAGLAVLPDGWEADAPYLVKLLQADHSPLWVVHRLDKVTSGLIVFALTAEAHRSLNIQFEKHEVEKTYHALVQGNPLWEEHTARHPLRTNVGHSHRTVVDLKRGKAAETRFRVIKRGQAGAWLEAAPLTGRTHQVRVHAAALGHPLIADTLYGALPSELIGRPALHAWSLSLTHPATGERMTFSAPHPADFAKALSILESNVSRRPAPTAGDD
jgi:RluA family pseudouridine synthase